MQEKEKQVIFRYGMGLMVTFLIMLTAAVNGWVKMPDLTKPQVLFSSALLSLIAWTVLFFIFVCIRIFVLPSYFTTGPNLGTIFLFVAVSLFAYLSIKTALYFAFLEILVAGNSHFTCYLIGLPMSAALFFIVSKRLN